MTKKKDWREDGVPFREARETWPAEYLDYPDYGCVWKPAEDFEAVLEVQSVERGRSAARFVVTEWLTGTKYTMFLTDFLDLVKRLHPDSAPGTYSGTWEFVKRGMNYGIKLK